MRFLIPKGKSTPNTSYYTYSDLESDQIEVWFDRIDRDWVAPSLGTKRPNPDNPIMKPFAKNEFNELFVIGKNMEEMIPWREIEKNMKANELELSKE